MELKNIPYFKILKSQFPFREKQEEKSLLLGMVYQEIPISNVQNFPSIEKSVKMTNTLEEKEEREEVVLPEKREEETIEMITPKTEVIQVNNLLESYNTIYQDIKIKNETNFNLSQDILNSNVEFLDKKNMIIFHTHTCESYTPTSDNSYTASGNYRTTDLNYSVAKVGSVLENHLTEKGFHVLHDLNYHDYPAYNGSYARSFQTVRGLLEKAPSTQLIIDLHRDAVGSMSNYAPSVKIGEEVVAQLMFVIGTNGGGMEHENWQTNLKYAIKIQKIANEIYPGLFRPIILRNSRYNQNLADSACIIEVGATGNTLEQAMGSMKYLAEIIAKAMEN